MQTSGPRHLWSLCLEALALRKVFCGHVRACVLNLCIGYTCAHCTIQAQRVVMSLCIVAFPSIDI